MISFKRLSEMAREENMVASVAFLNTGEILQSTHMKSLIRAINKNRHWEYTCQKYSWDCPGNDDTTLHLFYKIATASGVYYVMWFNIVNGIIRDKGFKCINERHLETVKNRNAYCYFTRT